MGGQIFEPRLDMARGIAARLPRGIAAQKRREREFVQFGTDEIQPFLQMVALLRARRGRDLQLRNAICYILENGWPLGQDLAIIEFENRDLAERVNLAKAAASGQRAIAGTDLNEFRRKTGFIQSGAGSQGTCKGNEI